MSTHGQKHSSKRVRAPTHSIERQINAKRQIARFNATRHLRPTCGATARSTGEPCRNMPMTNGRCYRHGGRVPRGKDWHVAQWPDGNSPDAEEKLALKLATLEKRRRKRAERLARRSPEERAAYAAWQRAHRPGSPEARAVAREERRQAREARARLEAGDVGKPRSPELQELDGMIAVLRRTIRDRRSTQPDTELTNEIDRGAFG